MIDRPTFLPPSLPPSYLSILSSKCTVPILGVLASVTSEPLYSPNPPSPQSNHPPCRWNCGCHYYSPVLFLSRLSLSTFKAVVPDRFARVCVGGSAVSPVSRSVLIAVSRVFLPSSDGRFLRCGCGCQFRVRWFTRTANKTTKGQKDKRTGC